MPWWRRCSTHAQATWPDRWHELAPLPFRFASWVGYDMDGRTDITWANSIGFRLAEKAERLARYTTSLEAIDAAHPLLGELRPAANFAQERADDFAADLSDPAALSVAANRLPPAIRASCSRFRANCCAGSRSDRPARTARAPSPSKPSPPRCARTGWAWAGSISG